MVPPSTSRPSFGAQTAPRASAAQFIGAPRWAVLILVLSGAGCLTGTASADDAEQQRRVDYFERHIRPVLVERCVSCHGKEKQESSLRLDTRDALLVGGDRGPAFDENEIADSWLMKAIEQRDDLKMPPAGARLNRQIVHHFRTWLRQGATWPKDQPLLAAPPARNWAAARSHWSFRPLLNPSISGRHPRMSPAEEAWCRSPLDRFIWRRLDAKGLTPSPPASRRVMARRLCFDLLGLPPTQEQLRQFEVDTRPGAYERFVEQLLASPAFGERWGRHWMDVARYADNKGYVFFEDKSYPWAWGYRDYVVESLNNDKPFDQFVREQIAADQLELSDPADLRAMGFLTVGAHFMNNTHDVIDDRIDVVMRGVMGLTVTCARCHDHKYDPITQADYYSLYGVFRSSREPLLPPMYSTPSSDEAYQKFAAGMESRLQKLSQFVDLQHKQLVEGARTRASEYLLAAHAVRNHPPTDNFMLLTDKGALNPTMIRRWRIYLENKQRAPDSIWLPWRELAEIPDVDFAAQAAVKLKKLLADNELNALVAAALTRKPLANRKDLADRFAALFQQAAKKHAKSIEDTGVDSIPDSDERALADVFFGAHSPPMVDKVLGWGFLSLLPDRPTQGEFKKLLKEVETWSVSSNAPPRAMVLEDAEEAYQPRIFLRGNPHRLGPTTERRYLQLFNVEKRPFQQGGGRLELARAVTSLENPLTARVFVNRVWSRLFGRGLVTRVDDFGLRSEPPTHPELLDYLAREFQMNGWSRKELLRRIMCSATYRQASFERPQAMAVDPENRLVWRMSSRRRDFEATRDALLAAADQLDRQLGGPSLKLLNRAAFTPRRTLYGFIDRMDVDPLLTTFDFPSPIATAGERVETTTATQALFFMNSRFVSLAAEHTANRADLRGLPDEQRLERIFGLLYGRPPTPLESQSALEFQQRASGEKPSAKSRKAAWAQLIHAMMISNEFAFID